MTSSPPPATLRFSDLSGNWQHLVELMRRITFGRIEGLQLCEGQPIFKPSPRVVREIRLAAGGESPAPAMSSDFELKCQVRELFDLFAEIKDGVIDVLEVRHGLPFRVVLAAQSGLGGE